MDRRNSSLSLQIFKNKKPPMLCSRQDPQITMLLPEDILAAENSQKRLNKHLEERPVDSH